MQKAKLLVSLFTASLVCGCAGLGKEGRIGRNDGSDSCYSSLEMLDDTATYYKDKRLEDIAAGSLIGAGAGVLAGLLAGQNTGHETEAMIIGGIGGAVAGGFIADAYWKNKLQQANNQVETAVYAIESDVRQDVDLLANIDRSIQELVNCRMRLRDSIRQQYAEGKLSENQAREEWRKWGDLVRRDREEIRYLDDALDNIKKVEESYSYAAAAIDAPENVTPEMQRKWQQDLEMEKQSEIAAVEREYTEQVNFVQKTTKKKRKKSKEKKKLKAMHDQKIASLTNQYASKEASISNKVNPKPNKVKLMVASVHEKQESIKKSKDQIENLAAEANNSNGFQQITSRIQPFWKSNEKSV